MSIVMKMYFNSFRAEQNQQQFVKKKLRFLLEILITR